MSINSTSIYFTSCLNQFTSSSYNKLNALDETAYTKIERLSIYFNEKNGKVVIK